MKTIRFIHRLLAPVAVAGLLAGCQAMGPGTCGPAFGSLAHITSISPDPARALQAGEKVRLKVDVGYVLTADTGSIELIVLAADNSAIAQDAKAVSRGRGTSTLEAEFTVPATSTVRVYAPLVFQGQESTAAADGRAFLVNPR